MDFFVKKFCFSVWSWKLFPSWFQCALPVFDVFDQLLIFVLFYRFGRFRASFEWFATFKINFGVLFCLKLFYWLLVMRITFEHFSVFFISFWLFWPTFSFCAVWRFCPFFASFHWIKAFWDSFGPKMDFFVKKFCFAVWSWKLFPSWFQGALSVFDVFDQFLVFVLLGCICCFQAASFNWY